MKRMLIACAALWILFPACASSGSSGAREDGATATQANLDETRKSADESVDKVKALELEKARLEADLGVKPE